MDYKCNLDCPLKNSQYVCCLNCYVARKNYITEQNKNLWNDKTGFLGENGCKLSREEMPDECKEYNCKNYVHIIRRHWINNEWVDNKIVEVPCWKFPQKVRGITIEGEL